MLTFQPDENVKRIHEIKYICNMKVSIENLRKNKLIPQCKKCQQFSHTQKFCSNAYKRVKCGEAHETAHCKKDKSAPPLDAVTVEKPTQQTTEDAVQPRSCKNCVTKKNVNNNNKNNKATKKPAAEERKLPVESTTSQRDVKVTYAQVTKSANPKKAENNENITEILTLLLSKMNKMEQKISEMEKHQPKTPKHTNNSNKNGRK